MRKKLALAYSVFCYLFFLAIFAYTIGFVGNFLVPKSIDSGTSGSFWQAALVNLALIGLFGLQHSGMARKSFKSWWSKLVPQPVQRSTYVLLVASLSLALLFWQWRPMPDVIWNVEWPGLRWPLWGLYGLGWVVVFASAQMISSGHLFGLEQARDYLNERNISWPDFQTPGFYRYVRHPLMLGFILAFWVTPHMTVGHLLFAAAMTSYILVALQFEERDLIRRFGERYRRYQRQVPMLIPGLKGEAGRKKSVGTAKTSGADTREPAD